MDKKLLLGPGLIKILNARVSDIDEIVAKHPKPIITLKEDGSPVTKLDIELSEFVESLLGNYSKEVTFYSEENFSHIAFPLLALDPLDGTREYIRGNDEWAMSVALLEDDKLHGEGWIYNPKTNELFNGASPIKFLEKEKYKGEVSHSEWESGLFKNKIKNNFEVHPMGSIAYKLGRLSKGKCDFVVSLRPKNIWDIAGGTNLIQQAGMSFYSQGKKVSEVKKLYEAPLIWCHEEIFLELSKTYL